MSEFFTSRRILTTALVASLGLVGCSAREVAASEDAGHYIQNIDSPHSKNSAVPEGKVFPVDATVQFENGAASYHAPAEVAANTGLFSVIAFCGNPIDKSDSRNLYATMDVKRGDDEVWTEVAGIEAAAACADGTINAADKSVL